jgi:hypothetical protein
MVMGLPAGASDPRNSFSEFSLPRRHRWSSNASCPITAIGRRAPHGLGPREAVVG